MRAILLSTIIICLLLTGCNLRKSDNSPTDQPSIPTNKGKELIIKMVDKLGDYRTLRSKKDVVYTYTYTTADGKMDQSTEKYIFDGELSYGRYLKHERTFPQLDSVIEQSFDGERYWLRHDGELITDSLALKRVSFTRPTNFYWFTMFQKLLDPGLNYEYLGEHTDQEATYDVVKVSFVSDAKPQDIYQLYIDKDTGLVTQFLFTVAEYGVLETPLLMRVEYEEVDGLLLPSRRKYQRSNWNAEVTTDNWTTANWTDIQFDNGLKRNEFSLK